MLLWCLASLTVTPMTVSVKKTYRQRSERSKRPSSPYSTDSNYSSVAIPHKPYPKSERKRQLQEPVRQTRRNSGHNYDYNGSPDRRSRPPIKTKPQIPQHGKCTSRVTERDMWFSTLVSLCVRHDFSMHSLQLFFSWSRFHKAA